MRIKKFLFLATFSIFICFAANAQWTRVLRELVESSPKIARYGDDATKIFSKLSPELLSSNRSFYHISLSDNELVTVRSHIKEGKRAEGIIELKDIDYSSLKYDNFYVNEDAYFSNGFKEYKDNASEIHLITKDNAHYYILPKIKVVRLSSSLFCKIPNDEVLKKIIEINHWKLEKKDFRLASVLDESVDGSINIDFEDLSKEKNLAYTVLDFQNLERTFEKSKNKLLILTGHYENGKIYARDRLKKESSSKSFNTEELNALAKKHNVYLFYMGCQTHKINAGAGLLHDVIDKNVLKQLKNSFDQENFISFLSSFGTPENPLLITNELITQNELSFAAVRLFPAELIAGGIGIHLISPNKKIERNEDTEQGTLATIISDIILLGLATLLIYGCYRSIILIWKIFS